MGSPLTLLRDNPLAFIAFIIAVVVAITVHEFSHAAVATLQGDRTPRSQGRLTLNPIAHLDPLGSIALVLAGFGWGKPVQFSPYQLRSQRAGAAMVGLAGPASNFVLALLSALVLRLLLFRGGTAEFTPCWACSISFRSRRWTARDCCRSCCRSGARGSSTSSISTASSSCSPC